MSLWVQLTKLCEAIGPATIANLTSITALLIAISALGYTAKTYYLKRGVKIRGTFSIASGIACNDSYVKYIAIENQKDRAIVLFRIYLLLGHNYYIEIDNFEDNPAILKPFEVLKRSYDPIDFYTVNLRRISVDKLINRKKVKKRLVLSTSEGRYVVKEYLPTWDPYYSAFSNHLTAIIQPMRSTFKGRAYGGNAKYIVEFVRISGHNEIVPIYPNDYRIKKFNNFQLTEESLHTIESLKDYLNEKCAQGLISCVNIEVYDIDSWRNKAYALHHKETIEASYYNWFKIYFIGRFLAILDYWEFKRNSKKRLKKKIRDKTSK